MNRPHDEIEADRIAAREDMKEAMNTYVGSLDEIEAKNVEAATLVEQFLASHGGKRPQTFNTREAGLQRIWVYYGISTQGRFWYQLRGSALFCTLNAILLRADKPSA